jgi:non-ribosomal peptide synthetase component F
MYSGSDDVVFGSVVSGRTATLPEAEGIVGLLANTLPVRIGLGAGEPLGAWLDRLQALLLEIRQREATPLPAVRGWSAVPRHRPLFESLVAYENFPLGEPLRRWRGSSRLEDVRAVDRTHYPLTLLAALDPDLTLVLLFERARFEEPAIERLEDHLAALLAGMAAGEDRPLSALSFLTPTEAAQMNRAGARTKPAPRAKRKPSPLPAPSASGIERDLAAVWREILGVPEVDSEDSFFELGGHSLLAGRLLARVQAAFGVEISLAAFLDDPTLSAMAAAITAVDVEEPELDHLLDQLADMDEAEAERLLAAVEEGGP